MENKVVNIVKYSFFIIGIALLALAFYLNDKSMLALVIIGGALSSIGGGIMAYEWKSNQKEQELRQNGQVIQADIQEVKINHAIEVNGSSPYQIVAQWQDKNTNQMYVYQSKSIWYDPSSFLENKKTVPVYIDSNDPSRYFMDTSFLPKKMN